MNVNRSIFCRENNTLSSYNNKVLKDNNSNMGVDS